jgi:hypothetical protein
LKRAAKRARQRAAGYQGVKKPGRRGLVRHNKGRMSRDGRAGEAGR